MSSYMPAVETEANSGDLFTGNDLKRYIDLLWRRAWIIALAAVLAATAAYLYSRYFIIPIYESSTTLLINEAAASQGTDYNSVLTSERLARTYTEMLTQRPVLEATITQLKMDIDPEDLQSVISVQLLRDTQLIQVSVSDQNPLNAATIANSLVQIFIKQNFDRQAERFAASRDSLGNQLRQIEQQISQTDDAIARLRDRPDQQVELERLQTALNQYRQTYASLLQSFEEVRITEAQSTSTISQVEQAIPVMSPVRPQTMKNTLLAAVLGALLATGVIFLIDALDTSLKSSDDLLRMGLTTLGFVGRYSNGGSPITIDQPRSPTAESFRSLRTNLQYSNIDEPTSSLLITSAIPGEGKTTVASNLAVVIAQSGLRVALIDADLHRPTVHKRFGANNNYGISTLFVQAEPDLQAVLKPTSVNGLSILTTGPLPPNPSELLGSEKMNLILKKLAELVDYIIIDSPPTTVVTDAMVLSKKVGGVLLVARPGKTPVVVLRRANEELARVGAKIFGVVLNDADQKGARYGYHEGYYYYKRRYYAYGLNPDGEKSRPLNPVKVEKKGPSVERKTSPRN